MKTDIEINQESKLKPIKTVLDNWGVKEEDTICQDTYRSKLLLKGGDVGKGKLILVTAITPTPSGEGKTTISIALNDALNKIGKKSVAVLREPSLGPVFGRKGGATGGGYSQVAPMVEINLHFGGDFHAITIANNLIASNIDNHIYWGNDLKFKTITWTRCLDINDRSLRELNIEIDHRFEYKTGFQITAASEIMSILCLSRNEDDLRKRLDKIIIGISEKNKPIYLKSLNMTDSLVLIMQNAIFPNAVQSLENNLVLIHGGPFANISHGCSSIISTYYGQRLADYVVTEAGFGSDLGAEKFLNIKSQQFNLNPRAVVLTATIKALKLQGGQALSDITKENIAALNKGFDHLEAHVENIQNFNLNPIIAINKFSTDTKKEIDTLLKWCKKHKIEAAVVTAWADGSKGAVDLAEKVVASISKKPDKFKPLYNLNQSIDEKVNIIAKKVYGAAGVDFSKEAKRMIELLEKEGLDKQFICIAKTPKSLSDNPKKLNRPRGWKLKVRSIRIKNGAGLIVVYAGKILTMPGLPKVPQSSVIKFKNNKVKGLN